MSAIYVIVGPRGLAYVGLHRDEAECWSVYLGWPDAEEVEAAKAEGFYCAPATLTWTKQAATQEPTP